jgi:integrase
MAVHPHLFRRNAIWYWRRTFQAVSLPKKANFICSKGEVALSLKTVDFRSALAVGRTLSTVFEGWMVTFRMFACLEKIESEEIKALVQWALADVRDVYALQIPDPKSVPDELRRRHVKRLVCEAAVIQNAVQTGAVEMVEGSAAALLRRRSIRFEYGSPAFDAFVRTVAPSLIEARLAEILRLDPQDGMGWRQSIASGDVDEAVRRPQVTDQTTAPRNTAATVPAGIRPRSIEDCFEAWLLETRRAVGRNQKPDKGAKTLSQYRQTLQLLAGYFGNIAAAQITSAMAAEFKELVLRLPSKYGQSARYVGKRLIEIVQIADRLDDPKRMTAATWNRHHVALNNVWDHAKRHGCVSENVFSGVRIKMGKREHRDNEARERFGRERLGKLFSSPIYTGMRSNNLTHQPGELIERNARYWLPLISVTTGMRREEIAQLRRRDIETVNGILCIRIRAGVGQKIKTHSAKRNIPIPEILFRLGFVEFFGEVGTRSDDLVFADCAPVDKERKYGEVVGKWFGRYLRYIKLKSPDLTFHSFRHDFASELHSAGVEPFFIDYLMGHTTNRMAFERYSSGNEPALKDAIDKIDTSFLDALLKRDL